jgi:Na+/H+ antiporter NhaD/arsenite permease-like protein
VSPGARVGQWLRSEWLFTLLFLALPVLLWSDPTPVGETLARLPDVLDIPTLAALAGLLLLSRALSDSGGLEAAGLWLITRVRHPQTLALAVAGFAAMLSMVVTNDVALFIIVPLIMSLRGNPRIDVGGLVIFAALAVNAGSALSPVGNPQNLLLWQKSGVSSLAFISVMAPLVLPLLALLGLAIWIATRGETPQADTRVNTGYVDASRHQTQPKHRPSITRPRLLRYSLALYPLFLLTVDRGWALPACGLLLAVYGAGARDVVKRLDITLIAVFALMFIDLGLIAGLPGVREVAAVTAALPGGVLTSGMVVSQFISNVPAAILLSEFTDDWRRLAWGVNVGGFGIAIGSLANLIALRLAGVPGLWVRFHLWSLPALVVAWLAALATLAQEG